MQHIIIHGNSRIRNFGQDEARSGLSQEQRLENREFVELDTNAYNADVDSGHFGSLAAFVLEFATKIRSKANFGTPTAIHYMGIDEVPTLIALGAYCSDEFPINVPNYDRQVAQFQWPSDVQTVEFPRPTFPSFSEMEGEVAIRVEASYSIDDAEVDRYVPATSRLANIWIRPGDDAPRIDILQSAADLQGLRETFRWVLGEINRLLPKTRVIHLFAAAPVAAAVMFGQELHLRNCPPVQTYRYRRSNDPHTVPAIFLSAAELDTAETPLTAEDLAQASASRKIWKEGLSELLRHALEVQGGSPDQKFPTYLDAALIEGYSDLGQIPAIWDLVRQDDHVDDATTALEYSFDPIVRVWHLDDRMLLAMHSASNGDQALERRLARAFFWHEYLHFHQRVSRNTAVDVGGFANTLERLDYVADLYGVMHQADFALRSQPELVIRELLGDVLSELLKSFWAFDSGTTSSLWQQRRLRRYFNWYWQEQCVGRADQRFGGILGRQPTIEVTGPALKILDGRRIAYDLRLPFRQEPSEIALVGRNESLFRAANAVTLPINNMLSAFVEHDSDQIRQFFEALYDAAYGHEGGR